MQGWKLEFRVPAHRKNIGGPVSFEMPSIPVPALCACCSAQHDLVSETSLLTVPGYHSQVVVPYSLCRLCHASKSHQDRARSLGAIGFAVATLGLIVGLFWDGRLTAQQPCLMFLAALVAGAVFGYGLYRFRRVTLPGRPHSSCDSAVRAWAFERGTKGAFGKELATGTLAFEIRFSSTEYGKLVQSIMKDLPWPEGAGIIESLEHPAGPAQS